MKQLQFLHGWWVIALAVPALAEPLTLERAVEKAMAGSPSLESARTAGRVAEARMEQAGRLPNPELEFEIEEYDRDGEGFDSSEMVVTIGQPLELGGKRQARKRLAELDWEQTEWAYRGARLDVYTEVRSRFIMALVAQQRAELTQSAIHLAEKSAQAVEERVKAGREPPLQAAKAVSELDLARIDGEEARRDAEVARYRLAAVWGDETPGFGALSGSLEEPEAPPPLATLRSLLTRNPDFANWDTELQRREAAYKSARSDRFPDLEASVGFQRFEEDGTDSLAFGLGIPLPLFDRNQGEISATARERTMAESSRRATVLAMNAELTERHTRVTSAHARATVLVSRVIPALESAFASAEEGYRQGKLGYLDVLDAQRSLAETRQTLLDALADYHLGLAALDRLTATVPSTLETEP